MSAVAGHSCGGSHPHGYEVMQSDPTRTTTLRNRYASHLRGGFDNINAKIRDGIIRRDVFGLGTDALATDIPAFQFETRSQKVERFRTWLQNNIESDVLSRISTTENTYIRSAYGAGLRHAAARLREQGVNVQAEDLQTAFALPVHEESLQLLFTRNYAALQGITDEMAKQIADRLTIGFARGWGPRRMGREIAGRVEAVGKSRATTLARTEVINAHTESTLNRYERAGVEGVTIQAEFSTAGDNRVCPLCASLEGSVRTIENVRQGTFDYQADDDEPPSLSGTYPVRPPVHPNCRCAILPVVVDT